MGQGNGCLIFCFYLSEDAIFYVGRSVCLLCLLSELAMLSWRKIDRQIGHYWLCYYYGMIPIHFFGLLKDRKGGRKKGMGGTKKAKPSQTRQCNSSQNTGRGGMKWFTNIIQARDVATRFGYSLAVFFCLTYRYSTSEQYVSATTTSSLACPQQ